MLASIRRALISATIFGMSGLPRTGAERRWLYAPVHTIPIIIGANRKTARFFKDSRIRSYLMFSEFRPRTGRTLSMTIGARNRSSEQLGLLFFGRRWFNGGAIVTFQKAGRVFGDARRRKKRRGVCT